MYNSNLAAAETPLLDDTVHACLDFKGRPVRRSNSGGWRSASFIILVEVAERFAYFGISTNLISYLTGPLSQSTATAAAQVNAWSGAAALLPLLGAFIADSFLGRYRTIIVASLVYVLGLGLLTLSATLPSVTTSGAHNADNVTLNTSSELQFQVILFFFSLYLVAFAQGGHKPCVLAFGADQFDAQDPEECQAKGSFFNWLYFGTAAGILVTLLVLNYIQDNLSWVLGFAIPGIVMAFSLLAFLLGTTTYRFSVKGDEVSPFARIGRVFVLAVSNRKTASSAIAKEEALPTESSKQFGFLENALLDPDDTMEQGKCVASEVEEAKAVLRLAPIWAASLIYAVVFAQSSTLFTKQGATMDRTITAGLKIPAASLQCFISFAIMLFIPIYDRIFVPFTRAVTGKPGGITMLQRIGTGIALSVIAMVIAALVEMKRLRTAREHGLIDQPNVTVPMRVWWLIPQYSLYGLSDVFAIVGLQEFFYDQMPDELRSIGVAVYLSIIGVGSFLSCFLISVIEKATGGDGGDSWFADNLNKAHLDYFYWLLAALSAVGWVLYIFSTKSYIYARGATL
ncbi:Protein NRT1/ PTR FAMILY 5.16 [Hibiscus syriacus]|uniref:Protein NRT1/ PTR FAMILY 5.16 n=1 Tax=Hibiscus syriacus TaxID=106335 RepID=A0A6A2Y537_HIBSY|nr:protein NRT1/ PTR FAMILY 5.10-like [Hibiscus syriacus]KAE8679230.1 Protein NRT1/ PTR FAMILY 5.16 [Hibiscus syriacus]